MCIITLTFNKQILKSKFKQNDPQDIANESDYKIRRGLESKKLKGNNVQKYKRTGITCAKNA